MGAYKVIVVGGPKERLDLCKEFGADVTIDIEQVTDPQERIRIVKDETIGGRGADIVVEAAGFPSAIPEGLQMMAVSGEYIELGMFTERGPVSINPHTDLMLKNVNFHAAWGNEVEYLARGLPFIERREVPWEKLTGPGAALSGGPGRGGCHPGEELPAEREDDLQGGHRSLDEVSPRLRAEQADNS